MDIRELLRHVDHTLLRPDARVAQIDELCEEALVWQTASVCIPPRHVARARKRWPGLVVGTVIGFPLGYDTTAAKLAEARAALDAGADELDMVIDIGAALDHDYERVRADIAAIRDCSRGHVLKVIVETCYLGRDELDRLCRIVSELGVDYIKTSTGFGPAGALVDDIHFMRETCDPDVRIKAAGGLRSLEAMQEMLAAGADRIGASAAVRLARAATADK
ncbi:MAG: deoxyribose-phosphate aldolase [Bacillota bacterium]|nr:deoxyribose-phosphate aldolase [Bacillota bacterium]